MKTKMCKGQVVGRVIFWVLWVVGWGLIIGSLWLLFSEAPRDPLLDPFPPACPILDLANSTFASSTCQDALVIQAQEDHGPEYWAGYDKCRSDYDNHDYTELCLANYCNQSIADTLVLVDYTGLFGDVDCILSDTDRGIPLYICKEKQEGCD